MTTSIDNSRLTLIAQQAICNRHRITAGVHRGNKSEESVEVYKMLERTPVLWRAFHSELKNTQAWQVDDLWEAHKSEWCKLQNQIQSRVRRHQKQCEIATVGITTRGRPKLVHAYMYDFSRLAKLEILIPVSTLTLYESQTDMVSEALRCIEELVPDRSHDKSFIDCHEIKMSIPDFIVSVS